MPRLVVNPDTLERWEIELKPGPNRVGRSEQNDFSINHPTVSTYHCEFVVSDAGVMVKDLNSTRGTFVNGEMVVKETFLRPGQHVQLGSVDMVFDATPDEDTSLISAVQTETMMQVPVLPPDIPALDEMPPPLEPATPPSLLNVGPAFCKFHPKTPARFFCSKCQSHFCAPCVVAHATSACGVEISPELLLASGAATRPVFFRRLPGAFLYPLRGNGLLILMAGTFVFAGLAILSGPVYALIFQILALSYLFSFMQEIVLCAAVDRGEIPELPGLTGFLRGGLCLVVTSLISFGVGAALAIARFSFGAEISQQILFGALGLGCLYFPMAFLLAAIKGLPSAANPLRVLSAIIGAPLAYLATVALLTAAIYAVWAALGLTREASSGPTETDSVSTIFRAFGWQVLRSFIGIYLLTVSMRVLGLLYAAKGRAFGWFKPVAAPEG